MRSSRGDRGIDVVDPVTGTSFDIYQVKAFTGGLSPSRKSQTQESLDQLRKHHAAEVRVWSLVLPMNHTPEMWDWFKEMTADVEFDCVWQGVTFLDSLAAAYPDVIDYYLGDGKAQLEAQLNDITTIAGIQAAAAPGAVVRPAEAIGLLGDLAAAVNRIDPHFRYELQVGSAPPSADEALSKVGAVCSLTSWDGETAGIVTIYPKYDAALLDRPIPIEAQLSYGSDGPIAAAVERFLDFGSPLALPAGVVKELTVDLPGGLGASYANASISLGPSRGTPDLPPANARVVDPDGAVLAGIVLVFTSRAGGIRGGRSVQGHDLSGVVGIELRLPDPRTSRAPEFTIDTRSFSGRATNTIHDGVKFLASLRPGCCVELASLSGQPFARSNAVVDEFDDNAEWLDQSLKIIEDLNELSRFADRPLVFPQAMSSEDQLALGESARLARGERVVGAWNDITFTVPAGRLSIVTAEVLKPAVVAVDATLSLMLPDNPIILLGRVRQTVASAIMDGEPEMIPGTDDFRIRLVPGTNHALETVLLTP